MQLLSLYILDENLKGESFDHLVSFCCIVVRHYKGNSTFYQSDWFPMAANLRTFNFEELFLFNYIPKFYCYLSCICLWLLRDHISNKEHLQICYCSLFYHHQNWLGAYQMFKVWCKVFWIWNEMYTFDFNFFINKFFDIPPDLLMAFKTTYFC